MTASETRSLIDELVLMYRLEPVNDIFVEGTVDRQVIRWFLGRTNRSWNVRTVGSIEVPNQLIADLGFDIGERGRVIALAKVLSERVDEANSRVICLADRDFSAVGFNTPPVLPTLLITDYAALDLYAFSEDNLEKLLRVSLQAPESLTGKDLLEGLSPGLNDIYLVRAALHIEGTGRPVHNEPMSSCSVSGQVELKVNVEDLVTRSLGSEMPIHGSKVLERVELLREELSDDPRTAIHPDDVPKALSHLLRGFFRDAGGLREPGAMRVALLNTIEVEQLAKEPMFAELLTRTE